MIRKTGGYFFDRHSVIIHCFKPDAVGIGELMEWSMFHCFFLSLYFGFFQNHPFGLILEKGTFSAVPRGFIYKAIILHPTLRDTKNLQESVSISPRKGALPPTYLGWNCVPPTGDADRVRGGRGAKSRGFQSSACRWVICPSFS